MKTSKLKTFVDMIISFTVIGKHYITLQIKNYHVQMAGIQKACKGTVYIQ